MAIFFRVSDRDEQNFPKNQADLDDRLAIIKRGLPQQGDNIVPFAMPAFTLLKDCGLINAENIQMLSEKWLCERTFDLKMNPVGGVLRHQDLPMYDDKGNLRYYSEGSVVFVEFEGVRYYISNDWYAPYKNRPTKNEFYKWLVKESNRACQKRWSQSNVIQSANSSRAVEPSLNKKTIEVPISQIEQLEKTINNLCYIITNLDNRIGALENKINNVSQKVEEIEKWLKS